MSRQRYFATCARGLEPVVAAELRALGAEDVEPGRGGAGFVGDRGTLYRANLHLRSAIRVLQPLLEAPVRSPDELYDVVRRFDWSDYLTPDHTLAVDSNVRDSAITHSKYAALRVKDAICDQFKDRTGRRPSVNVERPMVGLNLHLNADHAILSLDSSGDSLHKRGYRPIQTRAPLNEALAAGLIQLAGWTGAMPFVDPMCGSGTLAIEAAWLALQRPPGLTRKHFGFMGWMDFDVRQWATIRDEARQQVRKHLPASIFGSDRRADAIAFSRSNARTAGIGNLLHFEQRELEDFSPPDGPPGFLLCNPPYGERLDEEVDLHALYRLIGEVFTERARGWQAWIFTGVPRVVREVGLRVRQRIELFNGALTCQLLQLRLPN